MKARLALSFLALTGLACSGVSTSDPLEDYEELNPVTILDAPEVKPADVAPANRAAVSRGEYMVELLGCGTCHTNGALIGNPDTENPLSGSDIGIAYESPLQNPNPGVVFAPNITSDIETGIGGWSDEQLVSAIQQGAGRHSSTAGVVMPWPGYAKLSEEDTDAIILYLRSTEPVSHAVPYNVPSGRPTKEPFVYFGVYWEK
jgi:mono/diheme cytochrome c family protein